MNLVRSVAGCLLLAASVLFVPALDAQQCPEGQDRSNRCEGLSPEFNSKPRYQIRGFFGIDNVANAGPNAELKVSYYVPSVATKVNLEAWELHDVLNYKMRAKLDPAEQAPGSWATFSHWPVADVLAPHGISPSALGVLVTLTDAQTPDFFAPALFYTGTAPSRIDHYTIFLTSDTPVIRVRCIVRDHNGNTTSVSGAPYTCELPGGAHTMPGSLPTRFTIRAGGLQPGPVSVTIIGEYPNDESGARLRAEIHFFHQPELHIH